MIFKNWESLQKEIANLGVDAITFSGDVADVAEMVSVIIKLPPRALVSEFEIRPNNP